MKNFLPATKKEMDALGYSQPDFVIVTGDPYIDHPSFGTAIIGRILERAGYKIAVLPQPNWHNADDFKRFGRPRLGFLINSGTVDSMVANYTANKKRRRSDSLSPGGKSGARPDRAVIVYTNRAKEAYKDCPVIIGGIEASLRRLSHYDYWDDTVRRSILLDSKADLLIYGMGEKAILEIAEALNNGFSARDISWVNGTVVRTAANDNDGIALPTYEEVSDKTDKKDFLKSWKIRYENNEYASGKVLYEQYSENLYIKQNIPQPPLSQEEFDEVYALPFMYDQHPMYEKMGGIPALHEIKFSIAGARGCFGNCAFCAITSHQGRVVTGRSKNSIVKEAELMTNLPGFKGYIHDIGGPTANFRAPACKKQITEGTCTNKDCMWPEPCAALNVDHKGYLDILRTVRNLPGIKKVFIRSGIRYDYLLAGEHKEFIHELCENHVSGTLKVAPEHVSDNALNVMRKSGKEVYEKFKDLYFKENQKINKEQYLIPYFISAHPGSTMEDALELAVYLKNSGFVPDQVQDFYPTPGTLSTAIYYAGKDPLSGEKVYVPKSEKERRMQRALMQFNKHENRKKVEEALKSMGKSEMIKFFYGRSR